MIKNMKIYNFISAWAERQEVSGASEEGIVPISNITFTPSTLHLDKLSYVTATFIKNVFLQKDHLAFRGIIWLISQRPGRSESWHYSEVLIKEQKAKWVSSSLQATTAVPAALHLLETSSTCHCTFRCSQTYSLTHIPSCWTSILWDAMCWVSWWESP